MLLTVMMDPPPPIVDEGVPAKAIIPLVRFSKCVLVSEKGTVNGIITLRHFEDGRITPSSYS